MLIVFSVKVMVFDVVAVLDVGLLVLCGGFVAFGGDCRELLILVHRDTSVIF